MVFLHNILPPNLFDAVDRGGICTTKQVITLSVWDIKKLTNLSADDILLLKTLVSRHVCPKTFTCYDLKTCKTKETRISVGCSVIDNLLKGGLRRGTLTEIYGESGSGKTQVALQSALHNWTEGCVYICTEDVFPTRRFEEIKKNLPTFDPHVDYGKNIFVEHITEAKDLLFCIRGRLPRLLITQNKTSLIIVDSIAAPYRCENTNYMKRAEELRELAMLLTSIAQEYNVAILCVNQVTASFDDTSKILPALGLAWSNMINTRLMLRKTMRVVDTQIVQQVSDEGLPYTSNVRELSVIFSPELPNDMIELIISAKGIHGIELINVI